MSYLRSIPDRPRSPHHVRRQPRVRAGDPGGWDALPPLDLRHGDFAELLTTRGSLTAALRRRGNTTVRVLHQARATVFRDEMALFGLRFHTTMLVREVLLSVDGEPWVFGRTLANAAARRLLVRAGPRPLASVLFTDPQVRPGGLHYRRLNSAHPLARQVRLSLAAVSPAPSLTINAHPPARRAVFTRGAARLCVTEVFLPAAQKPQPGGALQRQDNSEGILIGIT